ncbi:MAG: 5-guanidino-2-oxopentanoate decarboxylase [Actinomycetota bacterium]
MADRSGPVPPAPSVGQALVAELERRGVEAVFGIPGVHTIELYRGLAGSSIRHVTPRHEQGAGFMADGFARASGRPGVAFVITGPGVTNTITPMAQALGDSVPLLVVSGVNEEQYLGRGRGHLHELPDQLALTAGVTRASFHVTTPSELRPTIDAAWAAMTAGRPGPVHVQVPIDVFALPCPPDPAPSSSTTGLTVRHSGPPLPAADIADAARHLSTADRLVLLIGGGAHRAAEAVATLAEHLDAPTVLTVAARGHLADHPLRVPASPSLAAVRRLLAEADVVAAIGTELGPTDLDIYATGDLPRWATLLRFEVDAAQASRIPAEVTVVGRAEDTLPALIEALAPPRRPVGLGAARAEAACIAARAELSDDYRVMVAIVEAMAAAAPGAAIVGDSTQPIYAANLFYGHGELRGWYNSSIGFGALGYAIPAAIGAAVAEPGRRVLCLTGDGGAQFTLPELMTATDERLPITFLVWNNGGYGEIALSMAAAGTEVIGCDPTPPSFAAVADACGMSYAQCPPEPRAVGDAVAAAGAGAGADGPHLIEITATHR